MPFMIINLNLKNMRPLNFKHKMISVLFVIALMLQSCSIYKKPPASLDEAARANARTVVVNTDNSQHKFTRITQVDNEYYGEIKTIRGAKKLPLSESNIKSIKVLDKTATTLINLGIIVIPIATTVLLISNMSFNIGQ
jgi:PBP1b-binding outer membrane lipoprotein LpoB